MRLAVLGGSYNPIHIGHLLLAETVCRSCGYDTIAFIPAFLSPFKDGHTGCSPDDRVAMVQLAIADNPAFYCECCEIERQGISYTIDTLRFLAEKYPQREGKIGLVMGDDLLAGLDSWHEAAHLTDYADIIVGNRVNGGITTPDPIAPISSAVRHEPGNTPQGGTPLPQRSGGHTGYGVSAGGIPYITIANALLPVSSSSIRAAITEKKAWRYLVPPAVYTYIIEHNLYE